MGNIGHSQGLDDVVRALESGSTLGDLDAELRIAGHGMAADSVAAEIRSDRVKMLGLLFGEEMERELSTTTLALVTQRSDVSEFNLPSKLMNYMAHGLPVLAVVRPGSECARIVEDSGCGWVADSGAPSAIDATIREALSSPEELERRGRAGHRFAAEAFSPRAVASAYAGVLSELSRLAG
jgi:colanic acid biosynthesis glycosyl transferase WcaI